jgi:hypothetical protein
MLNRYRDILPSSTPEALAAQRLQGRNSQKSEFAASPHLRLSQRLA